MGRVRQQSQSALLQIDCGRPQTTLLRKRSIGFASPRESISFSPEANKNMQRLRAWFSRFLGLFRKNRRNAEMAEEMQQHVDLLIERNIAAGMSPDRSAPRRAATIRRHRTNQGDRARTTHLAMGRRISCRTFASARECSGGARAFSFLAILCLTLGIGTNAAVFSWIEGILVQALPSRGSSRSECLLLPERPAVRGFNQSVLSRLSRSSKKLQASSNRSSSIASSRTTLAVGDRANLPAAAS